MEVNVEELYEKINQYVTSVLVVVHKDKLQCIEEGSISFEKTLVSKVAQERIVGVYDYMVTQQQLREDLKHRGCVLI